MKLYVHLALALVTLSCLSLLATVTRAEDSGSDGSSQEYEYEDEPTTTTEVAGTTVDFLDDLKPLMKEIQRRVYPIFSELLADPNLSNQCTGSLLSLLRGVQDQKRWALMIATAWGTIPQNLFLGAQGSFGSYDQCLEAERRNDEGEVDLQGQYCTLYINPNQKMFEQLKEMMKDDPFLKDSLLKMETWPKEILKIPTAVKIGTCTPNLCPVEDLNYILNKLVNKRYGTEFEIGNCRIKEDKIASPFQKFVICFGYLLLLLVIIGTATDYYLNRVRDKHCYISPWFAVTFLMMFSARRNTLRLFMPYTPQTKELGFLNGIKVMLACWVVYGHSAVYVSPDVFLHLSGYILLLREVPFQLVANGFMAVSSFFFLSGFLLAYLSLKERARLVKQNPVVLIVIMFVRRYFRLVTPLMVVLCFSMLMPLFTDSPNDKRSLFELYASRCYTKWWTIPTLTSNFAGADGLCLGHSWYVPVDMQIFLVAAILVMGMLFRPRIAVAITAMLTLASCLWVAIVTFVNEYSVVIGFTGAPASTIIDTFDNVYINPITHTGCYLLGTLCAYVCFYHGKRLQWYTRLVCWILAHGVCSYVIFITVRWYRYGMPSLLSQSIYAGFHRTVFTIGLFWLIYACLHGMAPNVRRVLEHSSFRALGRLAFGIYLVHFAVVYMKQGLMKSQAFHPNQYLIIQDTLGILGISLFLAFLMNIAVESPIAHLDNFIFKKLIGRMIGEPQTHKEAEMIGRKAEVALTLEQHYEHWRRTSSKKNARDPARELDAVKIEPNTNGVDVNGKIFEPTSKRSSMKSQTSIKAEIPSLNEITQNGMNEKNLMKQSTFDKTKL